MMDIGIRRTHDRRIQCQLAVIADATERALLKCAQQQTLTVVGHVTHFIQKERPLACLLETSHAFPVRAGKSAFGMPKELTLEQVFTDSRHVHIDKRASRISQEMNEPREFFFTNSRLPNKCRDGMGSALEHQLLENPHHSRIPADHQSALFLRRTYARIEFFRFKNEFRVVLPFQSSLVIHKRGTHARRNHADV